MASDEPSKQALKGVVDLLVRWKRLPHCVEVPPQCPESPIYAQGLRGRIELGARFHALRGEEEEARQFELLPLRESHRPTRLKIGVELLQLSE